MESVINLEDYPAKYPDKSATFYKRFFIANSVGGYRYDGSGGARTKRNR